MDIMRPPLDQQVAPAPWLVARNAVDVPALIRKAMAIHPNASVDDIARQLAVWGMHVSGVIISMWMLKWNEQAEQAEPAKPDGVASCAVRSVDDAILHCTCDEESCTCESPAPPWWHQYCCGLRITPAQAKARDQFFEHAAARR